MVHDKGAEQTVKVEKLIPGGVGSANYNAVPRQQQEYRYVGCFLFNFKAENLYFPRIHHRSRV